MFKKNNDHSNILNKSKQFRIVVQNCTIGMTILFLAFFLFSPHDASAETVNLSWSFGTHHGTTTIGVGDTVKWTWEDALSHTITHQDLNPVFDSGILPAGSTFSHTFNNPGEFYYACNIHGPFSMDGTIMVTSSDIDEDGILDASDPENLITSSTTLTSSHTLVGKLVVPNGVTLIVPSGLSITLLSSEGLMVEAGGAVIVVFGGNIFFN